jgi:hypothetical protein
VTTSGGRRRTAVVLAAVVVAAALAGCTGTGVDARTAMRISEAAPGQATVPTGASAPPGETAHPTRAVICDVRTCELTLRTSEPREVRAFGTTLSLDGIRDGVAGLTVGDASVECAAGQGVRAGPLSLFCDEVTADSVTLTAEVA